MSKLENTKIPACPLEKEKVITARSFLENSNDHIDNLGHRYYYTNDQNHKTGHRQGDEIMARSFSDYEREDIRKRLSVVCRNCWTQMGYKKTSVDEICRLVGISKGAFYLFYDSKESLFCEVLCTIQREICKMASAVMEKDSGKSGMIKALKLIYRAYDENSFLYGSDTADYAVLMSRVSEQQTQEMQAASELSKQLFLNHAVLRCKVAPDVAASVIYSLIMNIKNKDVLPNHIEVFDFMVEHLIGALYE